MKSLKHFLPEGWGFNPQEASEQVNENAEDLNIGDNVEITGPVEFKGSTGVITDFDSKKAFVVVDLYNHGKHSFHCSDVSFNEYADSEEEDNNWRERDGISNFDESADSLLSIRRLSGLK